MRVYFKTNVDHYKTNCFPENLTFLPRKGEKVFVNKVFAEYFASKKLPLRLEVVDVYHTEDGVICELWYNETDKQIAEKNGAKLF
jgi:hypothetical protein